MPVGEKDGLAEDEAVGGAVVERKREADNGVGLVAAGRKQVLVAAAALPARPGWRPCR